MLRLINFDLSDVQVKGTVPNGTFTGKAKSIVSKLMEASNGDSRKAKRKLIFYINRAGDNLSNKVEINKAKNMLNNFGNSGNLNQKAGNSIMEGTAYATPAVTGGLSAKMTSKYSDVKKRYVKMHKGKAGGANKVKFPRIKLIKKIVKRNLPSILGVSAILASSYGLGKYIANRKPKNKHARKRSIKVN